VLRALAESDAALKSSEVAAKAGLFPGEQRSACRWLEANGFITGKMKREPLQTGPLRIKKMFAYWSATEKGRAYLQSK
jgi:hypothetical protein